MNKKILGLDLGTNSIGWALVKQDLENKYGEIIGCGSRIIPMSQDVLGKFDAGISISQTAERTNYRSVRKLIQRNTLRRERLHRVLHQLDFLPKHYNDSIDFEKKLGQFKTDKETKLNYFVNQHGKHEFLFKDSFNEMVKEFKEEQPELFYIKNNGKETKIPYDWTIYYLRKKALSKKISKEELSWLVLNFNQKRGYYQLRGEIDEEKEKNKRYEKLYVSEVVKTNNTIKKTGEYLYDIYFDNGWKYEKQTTKPQDWLHKHKEFIITTTTLKNGETKRTFKTVDSEKDWIAIKSKTEQDIKESNKTVGAFIYDTLLKNPTQKIRGSLVKTIERKFYREEFEKILKEQIKHRPEINVNTAIGKENYTKCVTELYPRNEAHANNILTNDFNYLFTKDILFYQRPLKSKKSEIANCQYEYRTYIKKKEKTGKEERVKQPLKATPKSHPLFQEFRLWQFIHNLKIYIRETTVGNKPLFDVDITDTFFTSENDWATLFEYLNNKKEIEQKHVLEYLVSKKIISKSEKTDYRWNYVEDKKYPGNETRVDFINRLKKVENLNVDEFLTSELEFKLWHIIYSVTDKNEYEKALENFAIRQNIDKDSFVNSFKKFPPFKSDYGAYSTKAIKKLLPLMRLGKFWDGSEIPKVVVEKITDIKTRLTSVNYDESLFKKDEKKILETIVDDITPKQLLKSFVKLKGKNHLAGLNTYQACYLVYERHSESSDITQWENPDDIDSFLNHFKQHSLRNPIVEQVVTETLRTVRDIWKYYGNGSPNYFNEIHIELGREMKNPADKRKQMSAKINENENTNQRIKGILQELMNDGVQDIKPYSPSQQEILKIYEEGISQNPNVDYSKVSEDEITKIKKSNNPTLKEIQRYKLWLEQKYISPYTGKPIPLSELFTPAYQIEHIIPQSRYFDNSLSNKIICESEVNEDKSNKTAYEYLKTNGGSIVHGHHLLSLKEYEDHCQHYFKKNRTKLKNLLSEEIPEGFINRQLNDSRYISKLIKGLLSNIVREENEQEATSKNIVPVTGSITSKLKQDWGLNDKWNEIIAPRFKRLNKMTNSNDFGYFDEKINTFRIQVPDAISRGFNKKRIDHRHHTLDALVIACCTKKHIQYLNSLNNEIIKHELKPSILIKNAQGDYTKHFMLPWNNFPIDCKNAIENTIVSFKQNLRVINKTSNKYQSYKDENGNLRLGKDGKPKKGLTKQTKGNNWAVRKAMHEDTFYGEIVDGENKGKLKIKTLLDTSFDVKKIEDKVLDKSIRTILINYLKQDKYKNLSKPHEEAFSPNGIIEMNKNIISLNNNIPHKPIKRVTLKHEKGKKFSIKTLLDKKTKFAKSATGTNVFFCIYKNINGKIKYHTPSFEEIIEIQKQEFEIKYKSKLNVPETLFDKKESFELLFYLQPNDLVYLPNDEELKNRQLIDFNNLNKKQIKRIYKFTDGSGTTANFIPYQVAKVIFNLNKKEQAKSSFKYPIQNEFGVGSPQSKNQKSIEGILIKERCIKLKIDRLGNISKA
ncbi:type II CRISPR RNA-guided endonuclease Cas9 [Ochrovirga pacifica]|uniref:type II CRISPR RNA-guided endonuclease Cas9 n=1 Tax=Ochrovirga pacifica TaxID=1042376 RepID=UPI0002EF94CD|nr:type II CRISPR RNA-guided endonuclease Cas9 [Ochrovirga pacifica]